MSLRIIIFHLLFSNFDLLFFSSSDLLDLWLKSIRIANQNLLFSLNSIIIVIIVVVTATTLAFWPAKSIVGEAFTVQFQALWLSTVASLQAICWLRGSWFRLAICVHYWKYFLSDAICECFLILFYLNDFTFSFKLSDHLFRISCLMNRRSALPTFTLIQFSLQSALNSLKRQGFFTWRTTSGSKLCVLKIRISCEQSHACHVSVVVVICYRNLPSWSIFRDLTLSL